MLFFSLPNKSPAAFCDYDCGTQGRNTAIELELFEPSEGTEDYVT